MTNPIADEDIPPAKALVIDFDGTIAEPAFPKVGKALPHAFRVMKRLKDAGWKLILWTCREDGGYYGYRYLTDAVEFCRDNGIEFDAVNESLSGEHDFRQTCGLKCRKPYAVWHIDDKNLGGFPGWLWVEELLLDDKVDSLEQE